MSYAATVVVAEHSIELSYASEWSTMSVSCPLEWYKYGLAAAFIRLTHLGLKIGLQVAS